MFEDANRYVVDLYGVVQDAYLQRRSADLGRIDRE
jgi:hypothetical protein